MAFIDQSNSLCKNDRRCSMIVPDKWLVSDYGEKIRGEIIEDYTLEEIWDLREANVFSGVSNSPIVYRIQNSSPTTEDDVTFKFGINRQEKEVCPQEVFEETYENKIIIGMTEEKARVVKKIGQDKVRVRDFAYVSFGAQPGSLSKFVFENKEEAMEGVESLETDPEIQPFIRGRNIHRYLIDYEGEYLLYAPDELHRPAFHELFENEKVVLSEISSTLKAAFDDEYLYGNEKVVFVVRGADLEDVSDEIRSQRPIPEPETISEFGRNINLKYLTTLLNSTLLEFYFENAVSDGLNVYPDDVRYLPIAKDTENQETLARLCDEITELKTSRNKLNLHLPDHLDNYSDGPTLQDLPSVPPEGLSDSILIETEETANDFDTLRVTSAEVRREGDSLTVMARPYVKPKDSVKSDYDTNSRGYATLDPVPAITFHDLEDKEKALVEAFVPYAVANEDGYTDNATTTISLIERIKSLTLPDIDDVEDELEQYINLSEQAKQLDREIEEIDDRIDEIVYDLYGLTDEEIKIVEEAVADG